MLIWRECKRRWIIDDEREDEDFAETTYGVRRPDTA
jgi:hypothetical protein